jgi:hypothetical protein
MSQVTLVPILLWLAALAATGIAVWRGPRPVDQGLAIDRLLRYVFLFPLGVQGLWAFVGHVFFPQESAAAIGWAPSPFQYEVGVANLGLGLACIYAAFKSFESRVAAGLLAGSFLFGAGIGHVRDIIATGNLAPGNAGPIMLTDFLTPIAIAALLALSSERWKPKSPTTLALEAELDVARQAMRQYRHALEKLGKG